VIDACQSEITSSLLLSFRYTKLAFLLRRGSLLTQQLRRRTQEGHFMPSAVGYGLILRVTSFSTYPMTDASTTPAGTP